MEKAELMKICARRTLPAVLLACTVLISPVIAQRAVPKPTLPKTTPVKVTPAKTTPIKAKPTAPEPQPVQTYKRRKVTVITIDQLSTLGPLETLTIDQLGAAMRGRKTTSASITKAYLARIAAVDDAGPKLNAVIATFPDAIEQAQAMDAELRKGKYRGPLHGIPILLKDNIEAKGNLPTTAGSLALKNNITGRDAALVARLREAGAVILGKTNLSEWANIRSDNSTSGWSAIGGLTKNPHALAYNTCGSSAGSGAAMAAGLAAGTVGTETDGSIVCPASVNGVVGFKPTVGMVSRNYIVPISHTQDTAGPMTGNVRDAAIMLTAMAGSDPADASTAEADQYTGDFTKGLSAEGLKGLRIGVLRDQLGDDPALIALFDKAVDKMRAAGAIIVEISDSKSGIESLSDDEGNLLYGELKYDIAAYLKSLPKGLVPYRSLADLIAFNAENADTEMQHFDQSGFDRAQASKLSKSDLVDLAFKTTKQAAKKIDELLVTNNVTILVQPTNGPAWITTLGRGDKFIGPSASSLPAIAGFPHLSVPMGAIRGLPVGISFIGPKWHDYAILKAGYAYEQASKAKVKPRYTKAGEKI
jgi:amidase